MKNFNENWINLLTNGGKLDKQREFEGVRASSKSLPLAIMKYRRLQMEQGRGQNIKGEQIREVLNDDKGLIELLQELFLEPVGQVHIEYIRSNDIDLEQLHKKHVENKGRRILNIALTI